MDYSHQPGSTPPSERVSLEEANEITRIWAERQKAAAKAMEQPTIHDVAEALNVPPSEVHMMLRSVRQQQSVQPTVDVVPAERRARKVLLFGAIGVALFFTIGMVGMTVMSIQDESRIARSAIAMDAATAPSSLAPGSATAAETFAPEAATAMEGQNLTRWPFTFQLGDNQYVGDGTLALNNLGSRMRQEEVLSQDLKGLIHRFNPPSTFPNNEMEDQIVLIEKLKAKQADPLFEFQKITVSVDGRTVSDLVPIARTRNGDTLEVIENEQDRILRSLANRAIELVPDKSPSASARR